MMNIITRLNEIRDYIEFLVDKIDYLESLLLDREEKLRFILSLLEETKSSNGESKMFELKDLYIFEKWDKELFEKISELKRAFPPRENK